MKIAFLGDISLNDKFNDLYEKGENPFSEIGAILKQNDYVVGNLECLSEGSNGENLLKYPRLKTKTRTLNYLNNIGLNIAQLAHNHVFDNLKDGFVKTTDFLDNNSIKYLGASINKGDEAKPIILKENDISVCLLNYVTHDTNPNLPPDADVYTNWFELGKVVTEISNYKKQYTYVIPLLHWGGRCEGGKFPDWDQPMIAKKLIDAGADLIIGNHSHTIQPYEIYRGKYIFYSLGNFCFSNIAESNSNMSSKRRRESCIPIVAMDMKNISINRCYSLKEKNGYVRLKPKSTLLLQIAFKVVFRLKVFWRLYWFWFRKIFPIYAFFTSDTNSFSEKIRRISPKKILKHIRK